MGLERPTDPDWETDAGRIPLWLDPDDVRWLAERCLCKQDPSLHGHDEHCTRIRWRADTALYKDGLDSSS